MPEEESENEVASSSGSSESVYFVEEASVSHSAASFVEVTESCAKRGTRRRWGDYRQSQPAATGVTPENN